MTTLAFPTITIRLDYGPPVEVPAEPTQVPGLYVTPDVHWPHLHGGLPFWRAAWRLTHAPSGVALPYRGATPDHVRDLARALATVRADWTDLPADLEQWPDGLQQEINRVGGKWECRRHRRSQPRYFWPVTTGDRP